MTGTSPKSTILATLWLTAALSFLVCEAVAAASVAPPYVYSYVSDYISQLGVPGWTRLAAVMNTGFCVQGVLLLAGAVLAIRESASGHRRWFLALVALYALGAVLIATAPAGSGAPAGNLTRHWLGALMVFIGGNTAIVVGSSVVAGLVGVRWYRKASVVLAVLGSVSFVIFGNPAARPYLGIWERGSVYSVLLWQVLSAVLLLNEVRHRRTAGITTGE